MNFTREEIKADLLENHLEQLLEHAYPEDFLSELADGYLPIFYDKILKDWTQMPSEFDDSWQDCGLPSAKTEEITILGLMTIDLFNYYQSITNEIWREIVLEREEAGE